MQSVHLVAEAKRVLAKYKHDAAAPGEEDMRDVLMLAHRFCKAPKSRRGSALHHFYRQRENRERYPRWFPRPDEDLESMLKDCHKWSPTERSRVFAGVFVEADGHMYLDDAKAHIKQIARCGLVSKALKKRLGEPDPIMEKKGNGARLKLREAVTYLLELYGSSS